MIDHTKRFRILIKHNSIYQKPYIKSLFTNSERDSLKLKKRELNPKKFYSKHDKFKPLAGTKDETSSSKHLSSV